VQPCWCQGEGDFQGTVFGKVLMLRETPAHMKQAQAQAQAISVNDTTNALYLQLHTQPT
jgi:hypothetical protein